MFDEREREARLERSEKLSERAMWERGNGTGARRSMGTPFIKVPIPAVEIDPRYAGGMFAGADSKVQVQFLLGMHAESLKFSWPMQCRAIVDEMSHRQRADVASTLRTLIEHLEEP